MSNSLPLDDRDISKLIRHRMRTRYSGQIIISLSNGKISHITDKSDLSPSDAKSYINSLGIKGIKVVSSGKDAQNTDNNGENEGIVEENGDVSNMETLEK